MITHLVVALLIVAPVGVALYLTYWAGYHAGVGDALREHGEDWVEEGGG